jgi:hypothetical protein
MIRSVLEVNELFAYHIGMSLKAFLQPSGMIIEHLAASRLPVAQGKR